MIAIIPARSGSKGIPNKNLKKLGEKSLIERAVESIIGTIPKERIFVSSDGDEILNHAKELGVSTIKRPSAISSDFTSMNDVIHHVFETIKIQFQDFILLQPTSPLRSDTSVKEAIRIFTKGTNPERSLISVLEVEENPYKYFILDKDKTLKGLVSPTAPFMQRQEIPKVVKPNGAIYLCSKQSFLKNKSLLSNNTQAFIMTQTESIDIDTESDLIKAETILKRAKK